MTETQKKSRTIPFSFKAFCEAARVQLSSKAMHSTVSYMGYSKKECQIARGEGICFGSMVRTVATFNPRDGLYDPNATPVKTYTDYFAISNVAQYIYKDSLTPWVECYSEKAGGVSWETARHAYFEWMLSDDSPWASVRPTLSEEEFFFWDTKILKESPSDLLVNFCIATRAPRERPESIIFWYDLVFNHGVHPSYAYFMCGWVRQQGTFGHIFQYNNNHQLDQLKKAGIDPTTATYLQLQNHDHWAVNPEFTDKGVMALVDGTPTTTRSAFHTNPYYKPCNAVWGGEEYTLGGINSNSYVFSLVDKYGLSKRDNGGLAVVVTYDIWKNVVLHEADEMGLIETTKKAKRVKKA